MLDYTNNSDDTLDDEEEEDVEEGEEEETEEEGEDDPLDLDMDEEEYPPSLQNKTSPVRCRASAISRGGFHYWMFTLTNFFLPMRNTAASSIASSIRVTRSPPMRSIAPASMRRRSSDFDAT